MDKRLLLSRLERIQTGNIADAMVNLGIPCKTIEGLWPLSYGQKRVAGIAATIKQMSRSANRDQYTLTKHPIFIDNDVDEGMILVIDAGGKADVCTGGSLLAYRAERNGAVGMVINGCLRDVDEIRSRQFPVYFKGGCPIKSSPTLETVGINIPVEIGNTQICPGDYMVMDATGIVIIPPQKAEQICNEAERIQQGELKVRKMVEQGASVMNSFAKVFKNDSKE